MAAPIKTGVVQGTAAAGDAPELTRTTLSSGIKRWEDQSLEKIGFSNSSQITVTVMDVGIIDQIIPSLLAQGIAKNEGDAIVINTADMGINKVLGSGKVTKKLNISAQAFSESAKIKIEKMGGKTQIV